jgi:hypothetical protein
MSCGISMRFHVHMLGTAMSSAENMQWVQMSFCVWQECLIIPLRLKTCSSVWINNPALVNININENELCFMLVIYKDYTEMHGQQNIKFNNYSFYIFKWLVFIPEMKSVYNAVRTEILTLILLTWRKWWVPNNASKEQMGFNLAFKGLNEIQLGFSP